MVNVGLCPNPRGSEIKIGRNMTDSNSKRPTGSPSRRTFLKSTAATGAVVAGASVLPRSGQSAPGKQDIPKIRSTRWRLEAVRVEQSFSDGSTVPFFRFQSRGTTPSNGELPMLRSRMGRRVNVRIKNSLSFAIQPRIVGYQDGPVISPGENKYWAFDMPPTGTWMRTDALLGPVAGSAGFAACLVSDGFRLANNKGPISREYFLLYQDTDDRWNQAIDVGETPDENLYEPNYHILNGLTYPHTMMDPDTRIDCSLGENVLVRVANLGHVRHSLHFHGYHAEFLVRNNQAESVLPEKDTFELPGYTTAEIFLPIIQEGQYPVHPHSLTSVTDNGKYPGGQITMIDAAP